MSRNSQKNRAKKIAKKIRSKNLDLDLTMRKRMIVPQIYLDESGNTGSNLLDINQPVFSLASCKFSNHEAKTLLDLVNSKSEHEVHFKRLRRNKAGQDGLVRLMRSNLINLDNIKVNIFHKKFMITSKIVDCLIEHMMHCQGIDLYLNGRNIALSNMLYYCLYSYCSDDLVDSMYSSFVNMIKLQTKDSITEFYNFVQLVKDSSSQEPFKRDIAQIADTEAYIDGALSGIDKSALDPSIPAFFAHCVLWGDEYPKGFHLIHDDSKAIDQKKLMFAQFMDWTQSEVELGYDRRKYKLPLRGKSLKFASSDSHLQLQVSDVIASSFAYWASGVERGETSDYLFLELNKLNLDRLIGNNKIWPTPDVTPESLGTIHDGGLNAADHTPSFLASSKPNPNVVGVI